MKILESQNAVLTNFEVYQHLAEQRKKISQRAKRKTPGNLTTLVKEILEYFGTPPNPLSQDPITYQPESIVALVERFRGYDLLKGEMIMIINLRPSNAAVLSTCIEDMAERFTEEQQGHMLETIAEVLGQFPRAEEAEEGGNDPDAMQSVEG